MTDAQTEFTLVDSTPVRGRVKYKNKMVSGSKIYFRREFWSAGVLMVALASNVLIQLADG